MTLQLCVSRAVWYMRMILRSGWRFAVMDMWISFNISWMCSMRGQFVGSYPLITPNVVWCQWSLRVLLVCLEVLKSWSNTRVRGDIPIGIYHLGCYLLKELECEKDLGVYVCSSLKTFTDTSRKVTSATEFFWAVRRSFEKLTPTIFRKVFVTHIRPILCIWPAGGLLNNQGWVVSAGESSAAKLWVGDRVVEHYVPRQSCSTQHVLVGLQKGTRRPHLHLEDTQWYAWWGCEGILFSSFWLLNSWS